MCWTNLSVDLLERNRVLGHGGSSRDAVLRGVIAGVRPLSGPPGVHSLPPQVVERHPKGRDGQEQGRQLDAHAEIGMTP